MRTLLLLRSFLIQGCWNYRTMVGTGLGWALLPVLRRKGGDGAMDVSRHVGHFNGHPYLMTVALGALGRAEEEGTDPEAVERFRKVLPAPLGSLGDGLIWASWRPACMVVALLVAVLGVGAGWVVAGVLALYNAVHLGIRIWGLRAGWEHGLHVGRALGAARLPLWAERIGRAGVLFLGVLLGLVLVRGAGVPQWGPVWFVGVVALLGVGLRKGGGAGRRGSALLLALIVFGFIWGGVDGVFASVGDRGIDR
jgi:mannose PTS system EIID component